LIKTSDITRFAKPTVDSGTPESWDISLPDPSKGSNGGVGAFFITLSFVISWFIKIELKQI